MNDRLAELQGDITAWAQEGDCTSAGFDTEKDIEMGQTKVTQGIANNGKDFEWGNGMAYISSSNQSSSQLDHMKSCFDDAEAIKSDIATMSKATEQIISMRDQAVLATSEKEEANISASIRSVVGKTNGIAKRCKNLLTLLKEENEKLKKEEIAKLTKEELTKLSKGEMALPPFVRVRDNLVNTLLRKFIDEMKPYQNAQQQYKTDIKKKVAHQVQMIKPNATDQEVDQIMMSEGCREALYQQQILIEEVNDQVKTQYRAVAGKYKDILTLEASVAELQQIFLDFALLTEQQGGLLDDIEYQMKSAGDYVEVGNEQIHEAINEAKRIRKKQCWILLIVVALIIIVLFSMDILP